MPMTYEDLTTNPWLQFNELVKRSLTFAVYVDGIDPATLPDAAAALQYSLESVDEVVIGVPEVGDEPQASIVDALPKLDVSGEPDVEPAIRVKGKLQGLELSLYITKTYVTAIVPAVTVMDDDADPTTAPEDFKVLVQFGLELCDLLKADALYLLDDDDEFRLPEISDGSERDVEPIWRRA